MRPVFRCEAVEFNLIRRLLGHHQDEGVSGVQGIGFAHLEHGRHRIRDERGDEVVVDEPLKLGAGVARVLPNAISVSARCSGLAKRFSAGLA